MINKKNNYSESLKILKKIRSSKNILINCHRRPDPDSVASAIALYQALKSMGIKSQIVSPDPPPYSISYLEGSDGIMVTDLRKFNYSEYDLFLILDSPSWDFVTGDPNSVPEKNIFKIQIDHHIKRNKFADLSLIKEEVSSTSEVLYLLFKDWNLEINKVTAMALLSGIIGDTLCFRIPAVTERTLRIAADLISLGADRQFISDNLFSRMKLDLVRFMGEVLKNIEYEKDCRFIWSAVPYEVFKTYGMPSGAKNQTANTFFGSTDEGDFGILMVEEKKGDMLVSLRSANRFDVSPIAEELGGGGHRDSSATIIKGVNFEEAVKKVLEVARKHAGKNNK